MLKITKILTVSPSKYEQDFSDHYIPFFIIDKQRKNIFYSKKYYSILSPLGSLFEVAIDESNVLSEIILVNFNKMDITKTYTMPFEIQEVKFSVPVLSNFDENYYREEKNIFIEEFTNGFIFWISEKRNTEGRIKLSENIYIFLNSGNDILAIAVLNINKDLLLNK